MRMMSIGCFSETRPSFGVGRQWERVLHMKDNGLVSLNEILLNTYKLCGTRTAKIFSFLAISLLQLCLYLLYLAEYYFSDVYAVRSFVYFVFLCAFCIVFINSEFIKKYDWNFRFEMVLSILLHGAVGAFLFAGVFVVNGTGILNVFLPVFAAMYHAGIISFCVYKIYRP